MSVTISIAGNAAYCEQRKLGTIHSETCLCASSIGRADRDCQDCQGSGVHSFKERPYEMTISLECFDRIWKGLRLANKGTEGSIDGRTLIAAIEMFGPVAVADASEHSKRQPQCSFVDQHAGERIAFQLDMLMVLARQGELREENVIWSDMLPE